MLRPIYVHHYLSVMRSQGFSDEHLVAGTSIDTTELEEPDYLISHEDHHAFVRNLVRLQGDSGLELGLRSEAPHFGILAYAGLSCPTIRHGMREVWSRYGSAFGLSTRLAIIHEDATSAVVEILAPYLSAVLYRFSMEQSLGALLKVGGALTNQPTPFSAIALSYAKPSYGDRYAEVFHCPVSFNAPSTCVTVSRAWLDSPLKTNDSELNRVCLGHLDRVLHQTEAASPVSLHLRQLLLRRMHALPSLTEAARTLGLSPRTLMRQLQKQGCTYGGLTEEIRVNLVQDWLSSEHISAKEASYRLGFGSVHSFRRAFKNWTGMTFGQQGAEWKRRLGQEVLTRKTG